ncbi:MAG: peptide chain release factor 2 [Candidatus Omnitrophota bacterium]
MLDELKTAIKDMDQKFDELRGYLDLAKNREKIKELEAQLNEPEIWRNQQKANRLSRELQSIRALIGPYDDIKDRHDATKELAEIVDPDDLESINTLMEEALAIQKQIDVLEFKSLLGDEADKCSAILSINAGAGGTESCDWTSMLMRMYMRWADIHAYKTEIIDQLNGEEAGVKNVTIEIRGNFAFGYLKAESGVHRLVRISPFDANKRRHTSFASVDVTPDIGDDIKVEINENDLRIDTFRSSGAGGQHVNVTDSAVRIVHNPTGIVVQCQKERSQHKNKATAMKLLRAKLYEKERREREEKSVRAYGSKKRIEWGSQIRSYVLHPYKMVKDHRTGEQTSNAEKVLEGELDMFIESYLKQMAKKEK